MEHIIDATGKSLGRVASDAAILLRGKNSPAFERHLASGAKVKIINASKIKLTQDKADDTYHKHYTGHPGGMRYQTLSQIIAKKGYGEIFRHAVRGMLPDNKLRPEMLKNLKIEE